MKLQACSHILEILKKFIHVKSSVVCFYSVLVYIHKHTHIQIYIYIYIYTHTRSHSFLFILLFQVIVVFNLELIMYSRTTVYQIGQHSADEPHIVPLLCDTLYVDLNILENVNG